MNYAFIIAGAFIAFAYSQTHAIGLFWGALALVIFGVLLTILQ